MFEESKDLIILQDFFWNKFQYKFTNYEDLLKQEFISFEGNGFSARFWIKYKDEEYLFKETDECSILGELLSLEIAKILGVPCAKYRACKLTKDGNIIGVLSQKIYKENETLILGAQIIQEFLNHYYSDRNILELIRSKEFRKLYGLQDNLMTLTDDLLLKYIFNNLNNLEQLWHIIEVYFDKNPTFTFMTVNYLVETLLFDIFLMESDRHIENWGVIKTSNYELYRTCPLFDNAAIFGLEAQGIRRVNKVLDNKYLLTKKSKAVNDFKSIFYANKLLLTCSEDDIINAKARRRKNNLEVLNRFLKVSDSRYINIFFSFKQILENIDLNTIISKIELENGFLFSQRLKEFAVFSYYQNLEYINELVGNIGFRRV